MKNRLVLFMMIALFILSGCAAAAKQSSSVPAAAPVAPQGLVQNSAPEGLSDKSAFGGAGSSPTSGQPAQTNSSNSDNVDRLVIRNATLDIVVEDPAKSMDAITQLATTMKGFVVSSKLDKVRGDQGVEYPVANITIRVPADKLDEALAQIKGYVKDPQKDIRSEVVTGQDVTKEYTDLNSRLRNLEDKEKALREIMASATRTEDVMSVFEQISQTREQIEVIKGQIQYYQDSASMSAISISIEALASIQPLEIGGWQPVGVARDAVQSLIGAMQVIGTVAIWLVLFVVPIGLVIVLPIWLLVWLLRRGAKNRKAPTPAPPAA